MTGRTRANGVDPDDARREAQKILSDRRFHDSPAPRPFRGPLEWIGDRLHDVFAPIGRLLSHVPRGAWLVLAIACLAGAILLVVRMVRRRAFAAAQEGGGGAAGAAPKSENPAALERAADEAEAAGDYERAVRLRFRAGLLRLGARGAIAYRPSVTTGEVRRALGSDTFDELARTFEQITYGGQPASKPDADTARRSWPRVLEDANK